MSQHLIPSPMLDRVASRFQLLSEPVRLQLLNHLHVEGEMNVQQLADATGQHQANVSKHLQKLTAYGLVSRRREGLYVYYAIADPTLSALCMLVCTQLQQDSAMSA